jgi:hypothetical protein
MITQADALHLPVKSEMVDSIVTDPPYGLKFMGKEWDHGVPGVPFWVEALRVAKPGAFLLAFGGTRTHHRLMVAIEDAGWEIRDVIMWVYGSGFPKSHDVSKAIDKARHDDCRHVCRWLRSVMERSTFSARDIAGRFGFHPRMVEHWAARDSDSQPTVATWGQWIQLKGMLSFGDEMDAEVWRLNGRKGEPGDAWKSAEIVGNFEGNPGGLGGERFKVRDNLLRAPTDAARQWEGWGTALKPAWEPIIVARKPLVGTVSENVLKFGTGGLNIDGCRVGEDTIKTQGGDKFPGVYGTYATCPESVHLGRWPANLIHDGSDEVVGLFPNTQPSKGVYVRKTGDRQFLGLMGDGSTNEPDGLCDSGSAARFFYCAKSSKSDRGEGNNHPTVKPLALMRYLCRLVTPPGGVILDPFMGSGSTGKAAEIEGFKFIGIELLKEYAEIAKRRIDNVQPLLMAL